LSEVKNPEKGKTIFIPKSLGNIILNNFFVFSNLANTQIFKCNKKYEENVYLFAKLFKYPSFLRIINKNFFA
jgi:hypothetical protein